MSNGDEWLLVNAAVNGVGDLPEDVVARLGDERAFTLLAASTTAAVRRQFASEPSSDEIQEFVTSLKARFPDGADLIKPIVAEAVVRSAFGEEELIDGVNGDDIQALLFVLPYAIMSHQGLDGDGMAAYVEEVIALADEGEA